MLVKSIIVYTSTLCITVGNNLNNISNIAVQCHAYFYQNVGCYNRAFFAHLRNGRKTDSGALGEFFLFHITVDKKFE